jgi:catechol 2,3-dioxygenase-like lactoylglutathione lyase family enzyme
MADSIPTGGVHHFRLTVTDVDRTVKFYTGLLGFKKLMDLDPGATPSRAARCGTLPETSGPGACA